MFNIQCDNCKHTLEFDYDSSIAEYISKVDYINDEVHVIEEIALKTPLIYKCINCMSIFKYTFKEYELKRQESVRADVKRFRKIHVFKHIVNPGSINPDNGLVYCNICDGVDNKGNCYKDIIAVCPFVKKHEA